MPLERLPDGSHTYKPPTNVDTARRDPQGRTASINAPVPPLQPPYVTGVTFHKEIVDIPSDYVLNKLMMVAESRIAVHGRYPWRDQYGEGEARLADLGTAWATKAKPHHDDAAGETKPGV